MAATLRKSSTPPPDILKFMVGPEYRIPLFELVYHDCVVDYWYWGDYNNSAPCMAEARSLQHPLRHATNVLHFDKPFWEANKDALRLQLQIHLPAGPSPRIPGNALARVSNTGSHRAAHHLGERQRIYIIWETRPTRCPTARKSLRWAVWWKYLAQEVSRPARDNLTRGLWSHRIHKCN